MPRTNRLRRGDAARWIPLLLGAAALASLGMSAYGILRAARTPALSTAPGQPPVVRARKSPAEFDLPVYEGAFGFQSMETGTEDGSAAFSVRSGTAKQIAGFYRKQLPAKGWRFEWQHAASQRPGEAGVTGIREATGFRQQWTHPRLKRRLLLLVLDLPQKDSSAQAVLSWNGEK